MITSGGTYQGGGKEAPFLHTRGALGKKEGRASRTSDSGPQRKSKAVFVGSRGGTSREEGGRILTNAAFGGTSKG